MLSPCVPRRAGVWALTRPQSRLAGPWPPIAEPRSDQDAPAQRLATGRLSPPRCQRAPVRRDRPGAPPEPTAQVVPVLGVDDDRRRAAVVGLKVGEQLVESL